MKNIEEMTLKELYEEKKRLLDCVVGTIYNTKIVNEINKLILKKENENINK